MSGPPSQKLLGASLMAFSVIFFVTMNSLTKYAPFPSEQKVFIRMAVGVATVLLMIRVGGVRLEFNNLPLLLLRGVLGAFSVMFYFYAIDNTSLGRAVFFQFTYPAWGVLFSYIFLKEPLGWRRAPALAVTFAGAFIILAFPREGGFGALRSGDVSGLLCGLASGAAVTTIRGLHRYDSTWIIFFFFAFFAALLGGALTFARGTYVEPDRMGWLILVAIGVTGTAAQIAFTAGYRYLDVSAAGSMAMVQAPLSAAAGYFLFREQLSMLAVIGGMLVVSGGIYLVMTSKVATLRPSQ